MNLKNDRPIDVYPYKNENYKDIIRGITGSLYSLLERFPNVVVHIEPANTIEEPEGVHTFCESKNLVESSRWDRVKLYKACAGGCSRIKSEFMECSESSQFPLSHALF